MFLLYATAVSAIIFAWLLLPYLFNVICTCFERLLANKIWWRWRWHWQRSINYII